MYVELKRPERLFPKESNIQKETSASKIVGKRVPFRRGRRLPKVGCGKVSSESSKFSIAWNSADQRTLNRKVSMFRGLCFRPLIPGWTLRERIGLAPGRATAQRSIFGKDPLGRWRSCRKLGSVGWGGFTDQRLCQVRDQGWV